MKTYVSSNTGCVLCRSVVSDSAQPRGLRPARLLCPWASPGKNTGQGCHFPLQGIFLTQGSNPGLLHLLHWQEGSSSRGSSRPRIEPWYPTLQADSLPPEPSGNTPDAGQSHRSCHRHPCLWPLAGLTFHTPGTRTLTGPAGCAWIRVGADPA